MVMKRYWHLTLKLKLQTVCSDEYRMHWQPKMSLQWNCLYTSTCGWS
jgi:hypothetical protein